MREADDIGEAHGAAAAIVLSTLVEKLSSSSSRAGRDAKTEDGHASDQLEVVRDHASLLVSRLRLEAERM